MHQRTVWGAVYPSSPASRLLGLVRWCRKGLTHLNCTTPPVLPCRWVGLTLRQDLDTDSHCQHPWVPGGHARTPRGLARKCLAQQASGGAPESVSSEFSGRLCCHSWNPALSFLGEQVNLVRLEGGESGLTRPTAPAQRRIRSILRALRNPAALPLRRDPGTQCSRSHPPQGSQLQPELRTPVPLRLAQSRSHRQPSTLVLLGPLSAFTDVH